MEKKLLVYSHNLQITEDCFDANLKQEIVFSDCYCNNKFKNCCCLFSMIRKILKNELGSNYFTALGNNVSSLRNSCNEFLSKTSPKILIINIDETYFNLSSKKIRYEFKKLRHTHFFISIIYLLRNVNC